MWLRLGASVSASPDVNAAAKSTLKPQSFGTIFIILFNHTELLAFYQLFIP